MAVCLVSVASVQICPLYKKFISVYYEEWKTKKDRWKDGWGM